ncbi:MAG: CHAT domain-containing protein [Acidobacteriota bacterium]|nr:CHAT domain-containing protein [Acidobacteriota bacterium]
MRYQIKFVFPAILLLVAAWVEGFAASSLADTFPLRLNVPVSREFRNGARHSFTFEARNGEALEVIADKKGIDIGLSVFSPDGEKICESNAPDGFAGRETVFFAAEKSGSYRVEVVSRRPGNFTGKYTINWTVQKTADAKDAERAAAMKLTGEAREVLQGSENRVEKATEAIAKLQKALVTFEKFDDWQNQANTLFQIAYITGNEYGREHEAAATYEKALEIWRKIDDEAGKSICLAHAANELRDSGERERSLAYFNEAVSLNKKLEDKADEAVTLSFFCRLYNDTQKFQKGFEACRTSLLLTQDSDPLTDYYTYLVLGNLSGNTGDRAEALRYTQISLERILSVKNYLNPIRLAGVKAGIGGILYENKKYAEAIVYYQESLAVSEAVNRPIFAAAFLTDLGSVYYDLGQFEKSLEYGEKAVVLYNQFDPRRRAAGLNIVGKSYAALGRKDEARAVFLEAEAFFRQSKDRYAEADTLFNLAELEKSDGNLEAARQYIRTAVNLSEIIRADLLGSNSRSSYLAILKSYYELEVEVLVGLNDKNSFAGFSEQAWREHEKIRARSLLENFLENGLNPNNFAPKNFYAKEGELLEAIAAAELRRTEAEKTKNVSFQSEAERNLRQSMENYRLLQEDARRDNPQFSAVNQSKEFSFTDVQNSLDDDTALIEFALGKDRSCGWVIRKNSVKMYKLPARDAVNQTAREFYAALTMRDSGGEQLTLEKSKKLSRQILQPFAGEIAGIKRLIIIADGSLQLVPFAALTFTPDADFQPLAATLEIVNAPSFASLVYLLENKKIRQTSPDKLLTIFADPIFQADDERLAKNKPAKIKTDSTEESAELARTLRDFGVERLARLPFTSIEAREIAKFSPQRTVLVLGADASRRRFLSGDFNSYKILHFATHGFLNQQNPDLSGLVLSLYDEKRQTQNGFLRVIDLYSLRLNADLVVLSACQTGLGKDVDGEGIIGLTRGFMFAGASSVVSSLWKVEDAATAELMKRFYRAMFVENQTPSSALRTAQNELRQIPRWRSPNNWAGFTLTGNWH